MVETKKTDAQSAIVTLLFGMLFRVESITVYTEGIWTFSDFESSKRCLDPIRATPLGKTQITPMQTEAFLSKNGGASRRTEKIGGF